MAEACLAMDFPKWNSRNEALEWGILSHPVRLALVNRADRFGYSHHSQALCWPTMAGDLKWADTLRVDSHGPFHACRHLIRIIDARRRCAGAGRAQSGLFLPGAARHGAQAGRCGVRA